MIVALLNICSVSCACFFSFFRQQCCYQQTSVSNRYKCHCTLGPNSLSRNMWHIDNEKKWIDSINQLKIKFESQFLCLFLSLFLSVRCNPISINKIDDLSVNLLLICLYSSIKFKHGKLSLIISHTVKFRNFCFHWFIHWKGSSCVHDGCALCLKRFTRSPFLSFCVMKFHNRQ